MQLNYITIGDSYNFEHGFDHTNNGYTLTLSIRGVSELDVSTTSGIIEISAAQTLTLTAANHTAVFSATKGAERVTLTSYPIEIRANPLTTGNAMDTTSHNQKMLTIVQEFIEARATNGQVDHLRAQVDGKELWRMSMIDLASLRDSYAQKVKMEKGRFPKKKIFWF